MAGTLRSAVFAIAIAAAAIPSTPRQAKAGDVVVDVELVLAVDVSLSMSLTELEIQRDGYASAFAHEQVVDAILDGVHGKVAVTLVEWAGEFSQRTLVPWTLISTRSEADDFVAAIRASEFRSARRTSISGGLDFAAAQFEDSGFRGLKRVIDVSGDGPNNQGAPVVDARDRIVAKGITINGLPLQTSGMRNSYFDIGDLDEYYANCVIGGPGSFVIPVNDWSHFPEAVRRKLVLELAATDVPWTQAAWSDGTPPRVTLASAADYDCLVGERIWNRRYQMWNDP